MRNIIFFIISWIWGFIQSFIGLIMLIVYVLRKNIIKIECFNGSLIIYLRSFSGGVSMGYFIFLNYEKYYFESERKTVWHEYGHFLQHLILGFLYLLVVGIKSFINYNLAKNNPNYQGRNYYKHFPENWADTLGKVKR